MASPDLLSTLASLNATTLFYTAMNDFDIPVQFPECLSIPSGIFVGIRVNEKLKPGLS